MFFYLRMSASVKNIKTLLGQWMKKSRETKRNQKIISSKISGNLANIELRADLTEMNEISSYIGNFVSLIFFFPFFRNYKLKNSESFLNDIAGNLNSAVESCLADLDNMQPKIKTQKKKRKSQKSNAQPSKELKMKPKAFLNDESIEGFNLI